MDESREQFQSWFEEWFGESPLTPWDELWCGDGYSAEDIDHMWDAWTASRAAIEIELPPTVDVSNVPFAGNAWNAYRVEAVKAIRATGIKVKE